MTATQDNTGPDPQQIIAELQRKLDEARAELAARNSAYTERIAYQGAANDVLKVMSASPGDPQPVFDLISVRARDICDAYGVTVYEFDGSLLHWRAATGVSEDPAVREAAKAAYPTPPTRHLLRGRAMLERAIVHVRDHDADAELHRISFSVKSSVVVPLMRGNLPVGALHMGSRERGGFSDAQVELLQTFADQAVIAITSSETYRQFSICVMVPDVNDGTLQHRSTGKQMTRRWGGICRLGGFPNGRVLADAGCRTPMQQRAVEFVHRHTVSVANVAGPDPDQIEHRL